MRGLRTILAASNLFTQVALYVINGMEVVNNAYVVTTRCVWVKVRELLLLKLRCTKKRR